MSVIEVPDDLGLITRHSSTIEVTLIRHLDHAAGKVWARTTGTIGAPRPGTHEIGRLFMGEWLMPFELISLVLLAALLGAVFFTRTENAR